MGSIGIEEKNSEFCRILLTKSVRNLLMSLINRFFEEIGARQGMEIEFVNTDML